MEKKVYAEKKFSTWKDGVEELVRVVYSAGHALDGHTATRSMAERKLRRNISFFGEDCRGNPLWKKKVSKCGEKFSYETSGGLSFGWETSGRKGRCKFFVSRTSYNGTLPQELRDAGWAVSEH